MSTLSCLISEFPEDFDDYSGIAEKCFDIWGVLKMTSEKPVEPGNNSFSMNHIDIDLLNFYRWEF